MKLSTLACILLCLLMATIKSTAAIAPGSTAIIVSNLFNAILEDCSKEEDNVAIIKFTVPKDINRYNASVHESLPGNQNEAADLMAFRKSKLAYLKTGIRWLLIEEISDCCNLIILTRNCDDFPAVDGTPPSQELERYLRPTETNRLSGFGDVAIFDSTGQYGYRVANYFPGPKSVITSFTGIPPGAAKLGRFYHIEPELIFGILSAFKMTGPQFATPKATNSCHPSFYRFSNFRQDSAMLSKAIDDKTVTVNPSEISGHYSVKIRLATDVVMHLEFAPKDRIRFPKVEIIESGAVHRSISRRFVENKPWIGEWIDENIDSSGETNSVARFFLKSETVNFAEALKLFNDICVKDAPYKSTKNDDGRMITTQDTDSGRKIIVGRSQASILTQPRRNAIILGVIVVSALLPLFLNYKKLRSK